MFYFIRISVRYRFPWVPSEERLLADSLCTTSNFATMQDSCISDCIIACEQGAQVDLAIRVDLHLFQRLWRLNCAASVVLNRKHSNVAELAHR